VTVDQPPNKATAGETAFRRAQTREGWIAWREEGPLEPDASGESVLMIMGLAASSRMWFRLLPWIRARYRVILMDNRGTGSSAPVHGRLTMKGLAEDVVAVLDHADIDSAHVIGASMGGMVAQHVALDHRERVRSLLLACTTPGGRSGVPPWRLLAATAVRPLLGPRRSFPIVAPLLYAKATLRNHSRRIDEDLDRRDADATSPITVWAQMGAITGHDTRSRLGELEGLPTTVVHGLEDSLVPPAHGRELSELIPGASLTLIPSCGHVLTTDAEEPTATAILGHLDRCAARPPQPIA
jgi:pimeloyl-ACP methyl ester carboxylesterase